MMTQKIMKNITNTSVTNAHGVFIASFQYSLKSPRLDIIAFCKSSGFNEIYFNNFRAFMVRTVRDIT